MNSTKEKWYANDWVIAIGSGIILLIILTIWSWITGKDFLDLLFLFINLEIKIGWVLLDLFLILISLFFFKRFTSTFYKNGYSAHPDCLFEDGCKVILKTDTKPIIVSGSFNPKSNEVLCTWAVGS
jgi:hypothetical protein